MRRGIVLLSILGIAALLRFYQLGKNPPSLNLDEVAIGYNAYSILKTGRDEYGKLFPLVFRSHDDYKPPLYIYLTVPTIAVFGLNEFAIRFPSALAGTLTVLVTYFLVKELTENNKAIKQFNNRTIAAIAAFLLAISPWHLQVSRVAFETNIAVFFTVLGTWAFLKGVRGSANWWLITALTFALSLYTYQTSRLFIPLLLLVLVLIFAKSIWAKRREALTAFLLFVLISVPLIPILVSNEGQMRFKGTSVFNHPGLIEEDATRALIDAKREDRFALTIYHNRYLMALLTITEGYLKHFRFDLLFLGTTGLPVNYTPNVGLLYLIELPFIIWGIHRIASLKNRQPIALLGSWLLLSPLASALTWDAPSSTRMTVALPTFQIFSAFGLSSFVAWAKLREKRQQQFLYACILILFLLSIGQYLHQYYIHAPIESAQGFQYGYKEAVEYTDQYKDEYRQVVVSTNLRQPQNFFAFYTGYDPQTYIKVDGGTVSGGFLETKNRFGKYAFHPIDYANLNPNDHILLVDLYDNMPDTYRNKALKIISLPDGKPTIAITTL